MGSSILYIPRLINPCLVSLPNGLVAGYDFSESSGDLLDFVGNNDLQIYGTITRKQNGIFGNSYKFGNANSYIQGTHPLAGKSEWTVIVLLKLETKTSSMILAGDKTRSTPDFFLSMGYSNTSRDFYWVGVNGDGSGINSNKPQGTDKWLAVVQRGHCDGSYFYHIGDILGVAQTANLTRSGNFEYIYSILRVGAYYTGGANFNGWIDYMLFWDRELSDCELEAFYNKGNFVDLR